MDSSKHFPLRHTTELVIEFGRLFSKYERIEGFKVIPRDKPRRAELEFDGQHFSFNLHFDLSPSIKSLLAIGSNLSGHLLWVVPNLTTPLMNACRERQVSVIDLNGRVFLRRRGLLVDLPALPNRRYRFELEPRNIFVGKSARIVRALMANPNYTWKPSELVTRTGATSGLVSRIVTYLVRQGFLSSLDAGKRNQQLQLGPIEGLLEAWVRADEFTRRTTTYRYNILAQDTLQLARRIRNVLVRKGPDFAFTQWVAAWLRHPYTEPSVVSLYVSELPSQEVIDELGLHPVSDGGRVWFHLPTDEGVFRETRIIQDLTIVSDAQIYLDLQKTGLRGPEQAQALRESSVFCRP